MLAMHDKSMLISMPTKCGTERLKSTLVRREKVADELPEDHGWRRYHGFAKYVLLVRDPLERWVSTFWWLKSTAKNQGFGSIVGGHLGTFYEFANLVASRPSKAFVFQPLETYFNEFQPTMIWPLEHTIQDWTKLFDAKWLASYMRAAPHRTRGKKPTELTVRRALPISFRKFLAPDYALTKYPVPEVVRIKKAPSYWLRASLSVD